MMLVSRCFNVENRGNLSSKRGLLIVPVDHRAGLPLVQNKDSIPLIGDVAKEAKGVGLSCPAVVTNVEATSKKKKRVGRSPIVEVVQPTSSAKRVKTSLSFHEASMETRISCEEVVPKFLLCIPSISSKTEENLPHVKNDGQAFQQETILTKAMSIGNASDEEATQSIPTTEVPREKAGEDIVPVDSFPSEQAILASVFATPTTANDVLNPLECMARSSLVISPVFEGVTSVDNNFPILPLTNLDNDEDTPPVTIETQEAGTSSQGLKEKEQRVTYGRG
ncbi:hypothetical protein F0562_028202 [Nyssa sinensis]|uniref:Uncharacterized protein n=1 Tax=Nyssa sinensis TaxID=561372 RepID=A0A5J5B7P3_9ASTE|nr:hypothetical protein F0562_028202 [Nyssa sinensis]